MTACSTFNYDEDGSNSYYFNGSAYYAVWQNSVTAMMLWSEMCKEFWFVKQKERVYLEDVGVDMNTTGKCINQKGCKTNDSVPFYGTILECP